MRGGRQLLIVAALSAAVTLSGQESQPRFEVASVKFQHRSSIKLGKVVQGPRILPGGRFEADQVTVEQLVWLAYEDNRALRGYQFLGLPDWARANPTSTVDKFAISAKAEN